MITLVWEPPPNGTTTPTGYQLLVGNASGAVQQTMRLPGGDPRADLLTSPAPAGVYFVRIQALAGDVPSAPSNEVRVAVGPRTGPSAPADVLTSVTGSTVSLSWRLTYGGAAATGVRLIARVGGQVVAQQDMGAVEHLTVQGVQAGAYQVTLAGIHNGIVGAESTPVAVTVGDAVTCQVPNPPERLRAVSGEGRLVRALWFPAARGAAVTGYELHVRGAFTGVLPTGDRNVVAPAGPGTYHLSVVARNACGVSAPSGVRTVVVP
jgi:hypothetical protein